MRRKERITGLYGLRGAAAIILAGECSSALIPIAVYIGDPRKADRMNINLSNCFFNVSKQFRLTSNYPSFDNEQSKPFIFSRQPRRNCGASKGESES